MASEEPRREAMRPCVLQSARFSPHRLPQYLMPMQGRSLSMRYMGPVWPGQWRGDCARAIELVTARGLAGGRVIDLPSGVLARAEKSLAVCVPRCGADGHLARRKPGHPLPPGRDCCGEVVLADIGIPDAVIAEPTCAPLPTLQKPWLPHFRCRVDNINTGVAMSASFQAGLESFNGAARLSALAAREAGQARSRSVAANALAVNAAHLTSIMLQGR